MREFTADIARAGVADRLGNVLTAAASVTALMTPMPVHTRDGRVVGRALSLSYVDGVLRAAGQMFTDDPTDGLALNYATTSIVVTEAGPAQITAARVAGLILPALTASVPADTALPIAEPADRPFDAGAAREHIAAWAGGDPAKIGAAFLYRDDSADPADIASYDYPIADVVNGELQIVPEAVAQALDDLDGGGLAGLSNADVEALKSAVMELDGRLRSVQAPDDAAPPAEGADTAPAGMTAAAVGNMSLPLAPASRAWDGPGAASRVLAWATDSSGAVDPGKLAQAFLYRDDSADPATLAAYKLPFADVINGTLTAVPAALTAVAGALAGARGGVKGLSDADRKAIASKLETLQGKAQRARTAAAVPYSQFDRPLQPSASFFGDPHLSGPTPPTVLASGEVFGHFADWESCHRSFVAAGLCLTPPRSKCDYCEFRTSTVVTADGASRRVGVYSYGGGHADLAASKEQATAHYDQVGSAVALVDVGEDEHGGWFHGVLTPTATDEQIYGFLAYPPSGDWREARPGSGLELIALTPVAHPGYVVQAHVAGGREVAIVAAFTAAYPTTFGGPAAGNSIMGDPGDSPGSTIPGELAALRAAAVDVIAASIGRDRASQVAELDALVHGGV